MGKKILVTLLIVMTTIIVVLGVLVATFDLNKYKPQIEKKVYEATGKKLKINGDIGVSFSPVGLSIKDIVIKNPKGYSSQDMLKLKRVAVALEIAPLLHKQLKVDYIKLEDMDLFVEKSKRGVLNLSVNKKEKPKTKKTKKKSTKNKETKLPLVNVNKILLSNINIIYDDKSSHTKAKIDGLNLIINDIALNGDKDILKALSLKGVLNIDDIKYDRYLLKDIRADFAFRDKVAVISPMELTTFGSKVKGKLTYDMRAKAPKIYIEDHIAKLDLKNVSKEFIKNKKISLDGFVKTDIKLSMVGTSPKSIKRTLNGDIYVSGKNFGIKGIDLNKVAKSFNEAKSLNKKDIAGFLLAGPVGVAASKGLSGGGMLSGFSGGTTAIKKLLIDAKIKRGVVILKDAAMKFGHNIIASKGSINLVNERLGVTLGLVNEKGCAKFKENITGTFSKPQYKVDIMSVKSVANTVTSFLGKLTGKKIAPKTTQSSCDHFYKGAVK